jgi:Na+/H+ antiporter NhaD/arsenite permease-like protein
VAGLVAVVSFKLLGPGFAAGPGLDGLAAHFTHEWVTLANLLCLLIGFALLARYFEASHVPIVLPRLLPGDWTGALALLAIVFVLSSFLDNIAAALIGGAMARSVFRGRVHVGYLAGIVAAANAGGSGSVVGDTTTTMMWIEGIAPAEVFHAYVAAVAALLVFGVPASLQQQRYSPIVKDPLRDVRIDWGCVGIVVAILACAIAANVTANLVDPAFAERFPAVGAAVAIALLASFAVRTPDWSVVPGSLKSAAFLLALVATASLMPVESLPPASWRSTLALGFISAVFDNIPLTALALRQGGYDWGMLAYAVGFGGSMIWFGSSAGVALSSLYPEVKSTLLWLRQGWHVVLAYVVGFAALLGALGWNP